MLAGQEGAASLNRAEWQEHQARRRFELLQARLDWADNLHPDPPGAA